MEKYTIVRYEFAELSEESKERAIEKERQLAYENLPEEILSECLTYELGELLGATVEGLELNYSLGYCQGDGVSFTGKLTRESAPLMSWPKGVNHVEIVRIDRHYSHAFTVRPEYFDGDGEELDAAAYVSFTNELRQICGQLERKGYDVIEAYSSRESALDALNDAGAIFLESGEISRPIGLVA